MKKVIKNISIILTLVLVLILSLYLVWSLKPKQKLNIYILDKTVVLKDRPEHKAFVWLLNQNGYVGPDGKPYSASRDYWGFFPIDLPNQIFDFKAIRINEVDTYAAVYDAAYYTDCYGVYSFEWYKNIAQPIHSSKVFGGLNQNDYLLLKKMKEDGKLIIGEYNMFSTPTNALIRSKAEALFNLMWTGWSGKVYTNLDPNLPNGPAEWIPKLYESQHLKPWPKQSKGIVLISNDGLIDVLEQKESLKSLLPQIESTPTGQKKLGLPGKVAYSGWFEFIVPSVTATIHANYKLDLTPAGVDQLGKIGLSDKFPAIIQAQENEPTFYFAGDFAENQVISATARMAGGKFLNRLFSKENEKFKFFDQFYTPLIENILDDYSKNRPNK
ncbi:hypothetical protein CYCD_28850 [Tenuifilaceae bacterium CYCD]|nr:hypothetical protein CYCD_28850 [Tenuifilaceae bacterium CYCD]